MRKKIIISIIISLILLFITIFAIEKSPRSIIKLLPKEEIIDVYYYIDYYSSEENRRIIKTKKLDQNNFNKFVNNINEMRYIRYINLFSVKEIWEGENNIYIYYNNYEVIINDYFIYVNEGYYKGNLNFDFEKRVKTVRYHKYYGMDFDEVGCLFYDIDVNNE